MSSRSPSYRPDVDGLRAVAILFVLIFHADPMALPGGFTGVDIFFVISGFLIAQIILSELATNTFSFLRFYARRARRLFPALIVVIAVVWGLGWFILLPEQYASLGRHIAAGAAFASNLLIYSEVGYFDAPAQSKPLLHLWSLGVEEQFYIVFPALLVIAARWRGLLPKMLTVLFLASLALNVVLVKINPNFAFYMPMTRFWEFLLGAALAYRALAADQSSLLFQRTALREAAASCGAVFLMIGAAIANPANFPGWTALLPTIGAFLLIGAGPQTWIARRVLAVPVMVGIGLISYPLYLWHWPLLVFGRAHWPAHPQTVAIAAVVISFALAWLTYRYVERPIRFGPKPKAGQTRILAATLAAVLCLGIFTSIDGLLVRYPAAIRTFLNLYRAHGDDYPNFPPLNSATNDKGPIVLSWGDSHAGHLMPGLRLLQSDRTFRLFPNHISWWDDCPPADGIPDAKRCPKPGREAMARVRRIAPDVVMLAGNWFQYDDRAERIRDTLKFLKDIGVPRIVLVGPVPWFNRPPRITFYDAFVVDPNRPIPDRLTDVDEPHFAVEPEVRQEAERAGVSYISPRAILCNEQGCLARLGNSTKELVQVDGNHFTAAGSYYLLSRAAPQIFSDPAGH